MAAIILESLTQRVRNLGRAACAVLGAAARICRLPQRCTAAHQKRAVCYRRIGERPVRVDITYMSVIDPHTGESFWDDSRRWGSLLVARATKDLIVEFKEELAVEEVAGKVTPSS
jgi:hypothetical protein